MAPFSAFASTSWKQAPVSVGRYNGFPAYEIQGATAAGRSTGDAMDRMEELAAKIPDVSIAWSGLSYQERLSSGQAPYLYAISLLVVFLCLAGLYESWSIPVAVLLVVPLGLLGAAVAVWLRGLENDVFFQVGLLTTMGLAAKNAILIVEFAEQNEKQGQSPREAALSAGAHAPAAHPHDLAGLHLRRAAAGHFHRRRRAQPQRHRHRGGRRHDLRHGARSVLRAAGVRGGAAVVSRKASLMGTFLISL